MPKDDQGIRKAAILIDILDPTSADAILERMPSPMADRIRRALLQHEPVTSAEHRQVLDELHRFQSAPGHHREMDVVRDESSESEDSHRRASDGQTQPEPGANDARHNQSPDGKVDGPPDRTSQAVDSAIASAGTEPLAFLNDMPIDVLASHLADEHPQAVSIVLAHLSPQRAAEYLAMLSGQRRADVLRRLARLEATDADVINDVERGIKNALTDRARSVEQRPLGLATLEAILNAVDDDRRREFLGHLKSATRAPSSDDGSHRRSLLPQSSRAPANVDQVFHARLSARELPRRMGNLLDALTAPPRSPDRPDRFTSTRDAKSNSETVLEFEDLADLDDAALARVFRSADPQVALLALCGAGRDLVDRILERLPLREARVLRRQIEQLGPTRLRDIESAQQRLAALARQMADDGQIKALGNRRFTVAA